MTVHFLIINTSHILLQQSKNIHISDYIEYFMVTVIFINGFKGRHVLELYPNL